MKQFRSVRNRNVQNDSFVKLQEHKGYKQVQFFYYNSLYASASGQMFYVSHYRECSISDFLQMWLKFELKEVLIQFWRSNVINSVPLLWKRNLLRNPIKELYCIWHQHPHRIKDELIWNTCSKVSETSQNIYFEWFHKKKFTQISLRIGLDRLQ